MRTDFLKGLFEKIRENKFIIAAVIVGVVLMLIPAGNGGKEQPANGEMPYFSVEEQEKRLEKIIGKISGAGKVSVMLSLKTGTEQVLASDSDTRSDGERAEETVVVSGGSGKESAVAVKYIYPVYLGAAVVAEGADSAAVRLAITETVSAVTGLAADQISVIKMK